MNRGLGLVLAAILLFWPGNAWLWAQASARRLAESNLEQAVADYKAVDLERAERRLLEALESLKGVEAGDEKALQLAARVHLQLGRVAVAAGKPEKAREHFRQALRRDPELQLSGESDPPKILRLFEAVRAELAPPEDELPMGTAGPRAGTGSVLFEGRMAFEAGLASYAALDLAAAEAHLRRASARLSASEDSSPEVRALAAKVHLQLGRTLVVAGLPTEALTEFREALLRDRRLKLDPKADPPKVLALFQAVQAELPPESSSEEPPLHQRREVWLGGAALPLILILAARRRRRRKPKAGPPELSGYWSLTTTLVSNNVGVPNGGTNIERVLLRQEGHDIAILDGEGAELFHATIDQSTITFSGSISDHEGGRQFTRSYAGSGTVSLTLIAGTLQMSVAHDLQTYGFQFQSNTTYDYNLTMTRH